MIRLHQRIDSGHTTTDRFLFAFTSSGAPDTTFAPGGQRTYSSISTGLEGYAGIAYNWNSTKLLAAGDRDSGSSIVGTVTQHLNN